MTTQHLLLFLGIYLSLMLGAGYIVRRRIHTVVDFVVAGRRLSVWIAVPTILATWFGAGSLMGVAGAVYSDGVGAVLADPFGCSVALVIAGVFYAIRLRRTGAMTVTEILGKVYGSGPEVSASILMIPSYVGTLAAQMVAMGYVIHLFTGLDPSLGMALGATVVAIYTFAGGMWAVALTDVVQVLFIILALALLLPLIWGSGITPPQLYALVSSEFQNILPHSVGGVDALARAGQILVTGLGAIVGQDLIQRILACRDESVARKSTLLAGLFYCALGMVPVMLGLVGRQLLPGLEAPDQLIPRLAIEHFSPLVLLLFSLGLVSAVMSTADSYLLAGASILSRDILQNIAPAKTEKGRIRSVQYASVVLLCVAVIVAGSGWSIFRLIVHSGTTLFVSVFVPVTAALYWPNTSKNAALAAIWGGFGVWLVALASGHLLGWASGDTLLYASATIGGIGSLVGFLLVEMCRRKP